MNRSWLRFLTAIAIAGFVLAGCSPDPSQPSSSMQDPLQSAISTALQTLLSFSSDFARHSLAAFVL